MRLKVLIRSEMVPILYRHRVVSLIKNAIKLGSNGNESFFEEKRVVRPYCFNLALPTKKVQRIGKIQIDENFIVEDIVFYTNKRPISLYVGSLDKDLINAIYRGLKKIKRFNFSSSCNMIVQNKRLVWLVDRIVFVNEKPIESETAVFKTNSPILVENEENRPVLFSDESFNDHLNRIMDRILSSPYLKGKGLDKPLKFEPIDMKKQVVKHTLKDFRENTGKPVMYLTGSTGIFKLSGSKEDLEIIYKTGIGIRTCQGFGMIELKEQL
ncbi:CRISPR-associated endoribonuclease Cas6 [Persephonella sp.]